jgi:hypothetical protein
MGAIFGSGSTNAKSQTVYAELQVQTSAQGIPIAIFWGTQRLVFNLIWYGNFQSHQQSGKGGGGKGGAKGGGTYTYTTAFMGGLCEGPLYNINAGFPSIWTSPTYVGFVWHDQAQLTNLSKLNAFVEGGAADQSTWPWLSSNFPSQALPYSSLAYVASSYYNLGYSPSLPNHGFECFGTFCGSYERPVTQFDISSGTESNLQSNPIGSGAVYSDGTHQYTYLNTITAPGGLALLLTPQVSRSGSGTLTLVSGMGQSSINFTDSSGVTAPVFDANPADIIYDFLTNPQYSIGLSPSQIDATSLSAYKTYCQSQGIFLSPLLDTQEQVSSIIDRWASLTNTLIFWSSGVLKFVPLGDTALTNSGISNGPNYNSGIAAAYTYTPNLTVQYHLGYGDFLDGGKAQRSGAPHPPLQVTRIDPADAPNHVKLEIKDRGNAYNAATVEWQDQGLVDLYGQINAPVTQAHEITDQIIAATVAQLVGQRLGYVRNTYAFTLGHWASLLEPGDLLTLTDPHLGTSNQPVRIKTVDEDENFNLAIVAEEFPGSLGTASTPTEMLAQTNGGSGGNYNAGADPGNVNPPTVFEPPTALTGGVPQLWISASGGPNYGGSIVIVSFDGTTYSQIGTLYAPTQQGTLYADFPSYGGGAGGADSTHPLSVDLTESHGVLPSNAGSGDADAYRTLCWLTPSFTTTIPSAGELVAYGAVAQGGMANQFQLGCSTTYPTAYVRRGLYGTSSPDHPIGSFFTRINLNQQGALSNSLLAYNLPAAYIGKTIYLKFLSFNSFGNNLQDPAFVTAYQYSPTGSGYGGGSGGVATQPTGLTATGIPGGVFTGWNTNPSSDNVTSYTLSRATSSGGPYTAVWTGSATGFTDHGVTGGTTYYYEVKANNAAGSSTASAYASATPS